MKKIFLPFLLTSLISMVGTSAFAHDIEVKNAEGKTIYYIWKNNKTELAVSYRGYYEQWDNDPYRYTGNIIIPEFVNYEGNTYRVRGIDDNAFSFCDQLTSITIPNSVTYFGEAAFQGCSGLTSIVSENKNPFDFYGYVFSNYTYSAKLIVPAGTKSAYQSKAGWSNFTNIVELKKRTVHVATAGTLPDLISDYDKSLIGELTLTGNLNGTDIGCIRRMAGAPVNFHRFTDGVLIEKNSGKVFGNLSVLDISGAKIVSGGEFYYRYWYNEEDYEDSYYTKNNVISSNMFHNCKFTKVSLPINVTSIDESAFYGCSSLTSVTIPNSVTSIGSSAFSGCSSLTSITIPNSVMSIGSWTFSGCSGLTSVTIPNSVMYISSEAFSGCSGLTSVTIPNSVTYIGVKAFYDCTNLNSITIPSSISHIDEDAFEGCTSLNSVYISDISAWCGIRFEMGDGFTSPFCYASHLFLNGKEVKDLVIPDGVTSIGNQQFYGCSGLTSVMIPNSVKNIGDFAFGGCSGLTSIISLNNMPPTCPQYDGYTFDYVDKTNCIVWVPKGSANAYKGANGWKDFLNIREFDTNDTCGDNVYWSYAEATKTLTIIGAGAMTNYSSNNRPWNSYIGSIQNVIIESGVTSIGDLAFDGCGGLTSVTIPNSVTSIGESAFGGCVGLTSITIPNSVTSIGEDVFYACKSLTTITIPNSVTSIESYAFAFCSGLTSITIPNSVKSIKSMAFRGCNGLTSIVVESGNAMYDSRDNCNAIIETSTNNLIFGCKNTTIPNSVTSIGYMAFAYCNGLTSVTIPNSVTSIGNNAFAGCSDLNSITIPNSVTNLGDNTFNGCSSLTSVTIGNGVSSIESYAFAGCSSLISVTIPNNVTSIGYMAFAYCNGLASIISLSNTPPTCVFQFGGYSQFNSVDKSNSIVWVPKGRVNAYKGANGWQDFNNIRELIPGDANVDGVVNVADVVEVVNAVNGKPSDRFLPYNADQTGNGVDANDVKAIVDIIMQK